MENPWPEVESELNRLRQARRKTTLPLIAPTVPLEDIVEVALVIHDRYTLPLDDAAKIVAYRADWPVPAIDLVLRMCREEATNRDQRVGQRGTDLVADEECGQ
jgi:hypothetical protein